MTDAPMSPVTRSRRPKPAKVLSHAAVALDNARQAGLLDGERTEHLSFRVPKALLETAQRKLGQTSPTEVGIAAPHLALRPIPRYRPAFVANPTPLEALGANSQN